ncbi:MAG: hypothetical protein EA401_01765 [Planctomycetota bacterium]|nr:MAG: hypothetical protein EA401_01765 [Planctomycetota bacterium]
MRHPLYSIQLPRNQGAALLLAIVILAGLLLLGLPFIFSQTLSLSGSLHFRNHQVTDTARSTASDLALALAETAMLHSTVDPDQRYSMFDVDLMDGLDVNESVVRLDPNLPHTVHIDMRELAGSAALGNQFTDLAGDEAGSLRMGISITDEGGKLDINALNQWEWAALLTHVGIDASDASAETLANHRFAKRLLDPPEEQRLHYLDELTREIPHRANQNPIAPLTTAQLARLSPYITAHGMGQGRGGFVDVGTVIGVDKRIRVHIEMNYTAQQAGNHRLTIRVAGQNRHINRNLDEDETWNQSLHRTFFVSDLNAEATATLRLPDGSEQPYPVNDTVRRFSLQTDGAIESTILPYSVVLLERTPSNPDEQGERLLFRAPRTTQSRDEDIHWVYDPSDDRQVQVNDFAHPKSPPLRIAREVLPALNVHHAPRVARQSILSHADTVLPISDDMIPVALPEEDPEDDRQALPISTLVSNASDSNGDGDSPQGLNEAENRLTWLAMAPLLENVVESLGIGVDELFEYYPLGLSSPSGAFSIFSRVTTGDSRDRPHESASMRQLVQTGGALVRSWDTQADWELLRRLGSMSRLHTWPRAVQRVTDLLPDETYEDDNRIVPATLPTYADYAYRASLPSHDWMHASLPENVRIAWYRHFAGADPGEFLDATVGGISEADAEERVHPDGLIINETLAWDLDDSNESILSVAGNNELDGFHWSMWIQPTQSLNDGDTLLEMRSPEAHIWPQIDDSPGSNDRQNILRLHWDSRGYLVLTLNGPSIERATAATRHNTYVHEVPEEDFLDDFWNNVSLDGSIAFNEQSLGNDDPLAVELAPAVPQTFGHGVQFWYHVPDGLSVDQWHHLQIAVSHNRPGGQAIMLDGLAGRNVSGLGPDAGSLRRGDHITLPSMELSEELPFQVLNQHTGGPALAIGEIPLRQSPIHSHLGIDAEDIFPARGTILIGNEYISYTGIEDNTLTGAYRAIRANTQTDHSSDDSRRWPVIEEHYQGRTVVPGSYRYRRNDGRLFTGHALSTHPLDSGDIRPRINHPDTNEALANPRRFRTWLRSSVSADEMPSEDWHGVHILRVDHDSTSIRIQTGEGHFPADFAGPGIIRIRSRQGDNVTIQAPEDSGDSPRTLVNTEGYLLFSSVTISGNNVIELGQIEEVPHANYPPPFIEYLAEDSLGHELVLSSLGADYPVRKNAPVVTLISLAVDSHAIRDPFFSDDWEGNARPLLQIEDVDTGRIEWIRYHDSLTATINDLDTGFFIHPEGFPRSSRGRQRTVFAGIYDETVWQYQNGADDETVWDHFFGANHQLGNHDFRIHPHASFATGSIILPVQNDAGNSYWFATGDVVTLMPDTVNPAIPEQTPAQMVIRYAATDGYWKLDPDQAAVSDVKNEWFTFTTQVPADYNLEEIEFLMGNAWSGRDLSVLGTANLRHGLMPRMDLMGVTLFDPDDPDDPGSDEPGRLYLGSGDVRRGGSPAINIKIDGLARGPQYGAVAGSNRLGHIERIYDAAGNELDAIGEGLNALGTILRTDQRAAWGSGLSLVMIGGEVMAVDHRFSSSERRAFHGTPEGQNPPHMHHYRRIIGRGLLGSQRRNHYMSYSYRPGSDSNVRYRNGMPLLHLPLGPVRELSDELEPDYSGNLSNADSSPPPAWLITTPGGSRQELIIAPNGRVEPWLRGLYGTAVTDWRQSPQQLEDASIDGDRGHLLIGWYPRYPAGLPSHLAGSTWEATAKRSRSFPWVSLAVRKRDIEDPRAHLSHENNMHDWFLEWTWMRQGFTDDGQRAPGDPATHLLHPDTLERWNTALGNLSDSMDIRMPISNADGEESPWRNLDGIELKVHWRDDRRVNSFEHMIESINNPPPALRRAVLGAIAPTLVLDQSDVR